MYPGSLGRQTTVNIGVRLLKPIVHIISEDSSQLVGKKTLTSNRQFGAARNELKEVSTLLCGQFTHRLQ